MSPSQTPANSSLTPRSLGLIGLVAMMLAPTLPLVVERLPSAQSSLQLASIVATATFGVLAPHGSSNVHYARTFLTRALPILIGFLAVLSLPHLVKRGLDLVLTVLGVLCISPILLLIAAAVRLDSKGPALYFQTRMGKHGKRFTVAKFRTMYGDGEERLTAVLAADPALAREYATFHKLEKDPRVTRVGRVLRKYSLDELPQLWSVVKGDMSLVGPRPYLERELAEMNGKEAIVLRATPGLTGMWQVSDRHKMPFEGRVRVDVKYVETWSPWLDMSILAKTFAVVVRGSGV